MGIKIIIASTSGEKAKYKERILDWIIAFCLLFFMHYIMSAGVTVVDKITDMLGKATGVDDGIDIPSEYGTVKYVGTVGKAPVGSGGSRPTSGWSFSEERWGKTDEEVISECKSKCSGNFISETGFVSVGIRTDYLSGEIVHKYVYTAEYDTGTLTIIKETHSRRWYRHI